MNSKYLAPLFAIALIAPARVSASMPVSVTASSELNGIRETHLPNGLQVLTKEVHASPVVFFSVYYHAGSVDEEVGQTGMSHLLEHMMFKGTKTRGPGVISATLQTNGANFNASTWYDRTEYHETLASDRLELAMQIESDRMENSAFDESQHQKEMTVVRSEYEAGENDPDTALTKAVRLAAYQVNPYRWETIGFRADIENIDRSEMYAYYKNFYQPNNATVVIVGDFDTDKALAMVRKYFGAIPAQPIRTHFITPEPPQEGERRLTVRRAGTTPEVEIAYHIPAFGSPDRYAIDVLESVLSEGRTARFFSSMIQSGLASSAYAYDYGLRLPDLLTIVADAQPGHTNEEVEKALLTELDRLQAEPITQEELARVLRQSEADYIFGKDSVEQQGRELGENAVRGDWRHGETYLEHLRQVTPADVLRIARKYLVPRNRTVGYFDPILVPGAHPGSRPGSGGGPPSAISSSALSRSVMPHLKPFGADMNGGHFAGGPAYYQPGPRLAAAESSAAEPSAGGPLATGPSASLHRGLPRRFVLDNGLTVVIQENHANPTVAINGAILSAGGVFDPADKRGLAEFTASQLSRGTETRSLMDIARSLEGVGASVNISGRSEYASISGRSLTRDFGTLMEVLADELQHPAFPQAEIDRAKAQQLAEIEQARQETSELASIAFANALFPRNHPYSSPTLDEQTAIIGQITRDDLVNFHSAHYAPDHMILTIVGDVETGDALSLVKKTFGGWTRKGDLPAVQIPDVPMSPEKARPTVIFVPDKAQVDVRYGYPGGVKRTSKDFYAVVLLDTILGGGAGLSSRLAVNVRDKMGLVYGIYASDAATLGEGPFEIEFGSNPANVDKAIAEMQRQLTLAREKGITPQEVTNAISYITGSYPVSIQTNGAIGGQLLIAQIYGLGLDYIQKRNSYYRAVTPREVNAAAQKYLYPDRGALVIAGTYTGKYKPVLEQSVNIRP